MVEIDQVCIRNQKLMQKEKNQDENKLLERIWFSKTG